MKFSSMIGSVLLALVVGGYFVFTEWNGWKQWGIYKKITGKEEKERVVKKKKAEKKKKREAANKARAEKQEAKKKAAEAEAAKKKAAEAEEAKKKAVKARVGTKVYRVDLPCDCPEGPGFFLESVEINDANTILTVANTSQVPISTQPPGHDNAQFLLEWRYVGDSRPRHKLERVRDIGTYPRTTTSSSFKLFFPRVADAAKKIQLSGKNSKGMMSYFQFVSVELDDEIPVEEWRRFESFKKCGFDRPLDLGAEQQATVLAHDHKGARGHSWSATGNLTIVKGRTGRKVVVRGDRPGKGELCLSSSRDGDSCESCQEVDIKPEPPAPEPDFFMKTCGGLPSKSPHWQFEVNKPVRGAKYQWSISHYGKILRGSQTKSKAIMRPAPRAGMFKVALEATYASGKRATATRELHGVYSCPQ
jgi:hypothetical protein